MPDGMTKRFKALSSLIDIVGGLSVAPTFVLFASDTFGARHGLTEFKSHHKIFLGISFALLIATVTARVVQFISLLADAAKRKPLRELPAIIKLRSDWRGYEEIHEHHRSKKVTFESLLETFLEAQPKFTKLWFDFLEWVLIMGALYYLHGKSESYSVPIVFWLSMVIFCIYVPIAIGGTFHFVRFPGVKSLAWTLVLSACISIASGIAVVSMLRIIVFELAQHKD